MFKIAPNVGTCRPIFIVMLLILGLFMDNKCFYPRVVSSRITPLKAKMDGVKENKMHRKPRNLAGMLEFLMINVQFNGEKHYIKQKQYRNVTLCSKYELRWDLERMLQVIFTTFRTLVEMHTLQEDCDFRIFLLQNPFIFAI